MSVNPVAALQSEVTRLKMENDNLRSELHNLREFVSILNDFSDQALRVDDDMDLLPALREVLARAMHLLDASDGSLALVDGKTNELVFVLVQGTLAGDLEGYRMPADEGIAGWVMTNRKAALVRDARTDQRFFADVDNAFKFQTQSIAAAPLVGDTHVLGVVEVLNQPGHEPFNDADLVLFNLLCRFAGELLAGVERRAALLDG